MADPARARADRGDRPLPGRAAGGAHLSGPRPAGGGPVAIRARGWGWRHAGRRAFAIRDLDLAIAPGERVLLLGPSGSGKSTLLAGLAGVLGGDDDGETAGELTLDGRRPAEVRGRAGLVLQDPETQVVMQRVGDDVAFGCENLAVPRAEIWPRVRAALDEVGLRLPLDHPTAALSGGQKQRLALAGALAMRPGLLLLDEPTAELDPAGVVEVRDAVARAAVGRARTLVVVEHRIEPWVDVVDRVVVLGPDGRLLADGAPPAVLATRGAELRDAGVWLPGEHPAVVRREAGPGPALLTASELDAAPPDGAPLGLGVDLALRGGDAVALTGPNGTGKTTLAHVFGGLVAPAGGVLRAEPALADGAGAEPIRWRSRELAARIGSVFQAPEQQLLAATVREELAVGPRALGRSGPVLDADVDALLERTGLARLDRAHPFTLSGGEKRRLAVAAVLATRPRVLVLDEPTFAQDARTWAALVQLLEDARGAGAALVVATHDPLLAPALGARELPLVAVPA